VQQNDAARGERIHLLQGFAVEREAAEERH
jgi:hypothetical protein